MSLTKLSLAGKNFIIPGQGEFGQWPGEWKIDNLFYSAYLIFSVVGISSSSCTLLLAKASTCPTEKRKPKKE
jgi:hypothetical protein